MQEPSQGDPARQVQPIDRVAVVLDGPPTPAWQARTLAALESLDAIEVAQVRFAGVLRRSAARRLRTALERHVFAIGGDPLAPVALEPRHCAQPGPKLTIWLSERPPPESEEGELLVLRHGGRIESLEDAFGRALLDRAAFLETELLLRGPRATLVVDRTVSAVRPYSQALSHALASWKLAALVPRAIGRLPGGAQAASASAPVASSPSEPALFAHAVRSSLRALSKRLLFSRPWSIEVRERGADPTRGWDVERPRGLHAGGGIVRWGDARAYADPFLFEHEGRHHLFCEEVPSDSRRGVISHTALPSNGAPADPPCPVLRAEHHLSYPFVFEHEGKVFMIPESSAAQRVELYRAAPFPRRWEREAILLDGVRAADATVFSHAGRLWLFAALAAPGASLVDELHLFSAHALHGPWQAHPMNPVVSDVRCARPAGAVQRWGAALVRPAQDCARRYGGAISFRAIDVLSPTEYSEHEVARLEPHDIEGARATHSYSSDTRLEAVDVRRRELRLLEYARRRRRRLRRPRPGRQVT